MKRITQAEAIAQGYTIDRHCYPHIGYRGERFNPAAHVEVLTDLEAEAMALLRGWQQVGDDLRSQSALAQATERFLSGAAEPAGPQRPSHYPPAKP